MCAPTSTPTPSEHAPQVPAAAGRGEWAAGSGARKRSVFGNYGSAEPEGVGGEVEAAQPDGGRPEVCLQPGPVEGPARVGLPLARSFLHRYLAQALADPAPEGWGWLSSPDTVSTLRAAAALLDGAVVRAAGAVAATVDPAGRESYRDAYVSAFGHAARGRCPLNETDYGDPGADPLYQPHRLADLAAFYRAFGLEVAGDAGERHDHLCLELEFMCVLAAKEAYVQAQGEAAESLALCQDAQKSFLREHLGRWAPAFARRLSAATRDPALGALAELTRVLVESECARFGLAPGSAHLGLRPVDNAAERACGGCGGATVPGVTEPVPAAAG